MTRIKPIALRCKISRGGFSGERVVHVVGPDGKEYKGLAPTHYCWTEDGQRLGLEEPAAGNSIDGLVAAQRLVDLPGNQVVVTTPDGEVFVVSSDIMVPRPEPEPAANVPV
jgi:hypothetical protein